MSTYMFWCYWVVLFFEWPVPAKQYTETHILSRWEPWDINQHTYQEYFADNLFWRVFSTVHGLLSPTTTSTRLPFMSLSNSCCLLTSGGQQHINVIKNHRTWTMQCRINNTGSVDWYFMYGVTYCTVQAILIKHLADCSHSSMYCTGINKVSILINAHYCKLTPKVMACGVLTPAFIPTHSMSFSIHGTVSFSNSCSQFLVECWLFDRGIRQGQVYLHVYI